TPAACEGLASHLLGVPTVEPGHAAPFRSAGDPLTAPTVCGLWSCAHGEKSPCSAHDLAVAAVDPPGPPAPVQMLQQRDRDPAGGAQSLARLAGGERLGQTR